MKTFVVVPTYNELENIENLLEEILKHEVEAVVVDDNSPDCTWKAVEDVSKREPRVHLLRRMEERGKGNAGKAGFLYALEKGAEQVVEMDADFSHNPKDIPRLLEKLKECDVVLGSRMIQGGEEVGRGIIRRIVTRAANLYIRFLLGLKAKDCNSGFRAFRRKVLEAIAPGIRAQGPGIVQEVLFKAHLKGFRICEIPIVFKDRTSGESKLGLKQLAQGYTLILKLRLMRLFGRI